MGWVVSFCRNESIQNQKQTMEYDLLKINQKLMSLQSYASQITNGVMNGGRPGWLAIGTISPYASAKLQADEFVNQHGYLDPKTGKYYLRDSKNKIRPFSPQEIFLKYLEKASRNYIEQLTKYLHEVEKRLTYERDQMSIKIKMLDAEYEANKSAISDSIKESVPKYA